jgi:hypothetical protein
MTTVWDRSIASGTARLVLLAIADVVGDDGVGFIAQAKIASKAKCDVRTVRRTIDALIAIGELEIVTPGRKQGDDGRATVYRVRLETLESQRAECPPGDTESGSQPDISAVPAGHFGGPSRTPMSALPSSTTSSSNVRTNVARESLDYSTDVEADLVAIERRYDRGRFAPMQRGRVGAALLDARTQVFALVDESMAAVNPVGWFWRQVERGAHIDATQRTPIVRAPAESPASGGVSQAPARAARKAFAEQDAERKRRRSAS